MQNPINTVRENDVVRKTVAMFASVLIVGVIFFGGAATGVLYQKINYDNAENQIQATCDVRIDGLRAANKQMRDLLDDRIEPMAAQMTEVRMLLQSTSSLAHEAAQLSRSASETAKSAARDAQSAATASTHAATSSTQAAQKVEKAADVITDVVTKPTKQRQPVVPDWLNTN